MGVSPSRRHDHGRAASCRPLECRLAGDMTMGRAASCRSPRTRVSVHRLLQRPAEPGAMDCGSLLPLSLRQPADGSGDSTAGCGNRAAAGCTQSKVPPGARRLRPAGRRVVFTRWRCGRAARVEAAGTGFAPASGGDVRSVDLWSTRECRPQVDTPYRRCSSGRSAGRWLRGPRGGANPGSRRRGDFLEKAAEDEGGEGDEEQGHQVGKHENRLIVPPQPLGHSNREWCGSDEIDQWDPGQKS